MAVKERVERLVKGMTELDDRVDALEQRVAALEPKKADAGAEDDARHGDEDHVDRGEEDHLHRR